MQLFYHPSISESFTLDETESQHCIKVLRHKIGDTISIIDGKGNQYKGIIATENHKKCEVHNLTIEKSEPQPSHLHIAIAPTKSTDRMEWFVEKATEIGVAEITPIHCQNSERPRINIDRLNKKAVSAIKQNQSLWLPEINPLIPFSELVAQHVNSYKLIAFVEDKDKAPKLWELKNRSTSKTTILIGPEGDFTAAEVQLAVSKGYQMVSLGDNVLRTETAGLVACAHLAT